jgi:hypothetical protein
MSIQSATVLRWIYALCLLGAGLTHLQTLMAHGLYWNYNNAPLIACIFWTALTFLDPLAAALLFLRPRAGLLLTVFIIVSDVVHNTWMSLRESRDLLNEMYIAQFMFMVFVLLTIRYIWPVSKRDVV